MTVIDTMKAYMGMATDGAHNDTAANSRTQPSPLPSASDRQALSQNSIERSRFAHRDVAAFFTGIIGYITPYSRQTQSAEVPEMSEVPAENKNPLAAVIAKWQRQCNTDTVSGALSTGNVGFDDDELSAYHQHASNFLEGLADIPEFKELVRSAPRKVGSEIAFPGMDYAAFFSDKDFDTGGKIVFRSLPGDHGSSKLFTQTLRCGPEKDKVHIFLGCSNNYDGAETNYSWSMQITSQQKFKDTPYNG